MSKSDLWMPLYIGDYLADTGHLSTTQHGAYLLLMMHYWRKAGLPEDDKQLSAIAKLPLRIWLDIKETIQGFFQDGWRHKRIDEELEKRQNISAKRAAAGFKGGSKSLKSKEPSEANASFCSSMTQSHTQSQQKEETEATASVRAKRGTRLQSGQPITPEFINAATDLGATGEQIVRFWAEFVDYWCAIPGVKGTKLDWPATWRNRVRELMAREAKGRANGFRGTNSRPTGHDAILAAATRRAGKLAGHDPMAGAAEEVEFPFGDGIDAGRTTVDRRAPDRASADHYRREPGPDGVLEGEIIAPDKTAAGLSNGWSRH